MGTFDEHDAIQEDDSMHTEPGLTSYSASPPPRRTSSLKRKLIWLLLIALLGVGGYGWHQGWFTSRTTAKEKKQEALLTVTRDTVEDMVTSQGKLEPKEYVDVGAQVSGQLKKIYPELGDTVKQGDLIAEIDPEILQTRVHGDEAQLKTLEAQLAEQNAQIVFAQQQYDRNQNLIKQDAVSKEVLQSSEADLKAAQARANSLRAQIEQANAILHGDQLNLKFTKIYAPMDGTVVVQSAREGQTLNANQTAPIIVQLAKLSTMTVRAQVAEADVTSIKPDIDVYFTILGNMQRKWQGKVRQILPSPEVINDVVLYDVLIDVDNQDNILMSGMTTQVFFILGKAENVLTLPVTALGKPVTDQNNDKGHAYVVRTPNDKTPLEKIVHVGLMNRSIAEIRDGVSEGDKVLPAVTATADDKAKTAGGGPRMGPRI